MELIAAIMAAPDYKARFKDAVTLLNYGFGNCRLYKDETPPELPKLSVTGGKEPEVELSYGVTFTYLGLHGEDFSGVERELMLEESAKAPVKAGRPAWNAALPVQWGGDRKHPCHCGPGCGSRGIF